MSLIFHPPFFWVDEKGQKGPKEMGPKGSSSKKMNNWLCFSQLSSTFSFIELKNSGFKVYRTLGLAFAHLFSSVLILSHIRSNSLSC